MLIKWIKLILTAIYAFIILNYALLRFCLQGCKIPAVKFDSEKKVLDISRQSKSFKEGITLDQILLEINQRQGLLSLSLSGQSLQIADIIAIFQCLQSQQNIQSVDISRNQIGLATDEPLIKLVELISMCKSLTQIDLGSNLLTSDKSDYLVRELLKKLPKLAYIILFNNRIDDNGAVMLAKYPVTINLSGNSKISKETTAALATAFHVSVMEKDPQNTNKNNIVFRSYQISDPAKLCQFWRKNGVAATVPSLVQLCIFKIKSNTKCLQQAGQLPVELQAELRRNVIF